MERYLRICSCLLFASILMLSGNINDGLAQERKLTLNELTDNSELIVEGKVTNRRSEWNTDQTRIYTHVTIAVDQYLKGANPEQSVMVTHLGGEIGEVGEIYSGAARFVDDEEVLVFLKKDPQGRLEVSGASQGKFSISRDQTTGERMVGKNKPLRAFREEIRRIVVK